MTYPTTAPAGGAYPINAAWGATGTFANTDQNNTNSVGNYAWGAADSLPTVARMATTGAETTITIVSGSVTLISGTTIDGVTSAVNDVVLVKDAPASTGAGSVGSSQPGNGLYYVTGLSGGTQLARAATMSSVSSQANPAGRVVLVRPGGTVNANTIWEVVAPFGVAGFTYGTTAMQWRPWALANVSNPQAGINNVNFAQQSQVVVAATAYYVTNSGLALPKAAAAPIGAVGLIANKTALTWRIAMAKTAAGTTAFNIILYRGTNGTTADTADQTISIGTQTAAADNLFLDITIVPTTVGTLNTANGVYYYSVIPRNTAGAGVGFGCPASAGFLSGTTSSVLLNGTGLIFGIGFSSTLGTPTVTVPQVQAYAYNMV